VQGANASPLEFQGHKITVCICYEDIIPSFINSVVRSGEPDLLVNMTNDAWFGDTTAPWIHIGMARLRAVEHRRFLVRSTNSGVSAFVDPVGRIVAHTDTFKQQAKVAEVAWLKTRTPYELYGDVPWWLLTALAMGMSFVRRPERTAARQGVPPAAGEEAIG
ncbi:MAG TPA: nitrilase-related carbon-nitrogen hydrolase, partial [Polyangiaceae bacterium]|nr:nitrilase-related carbon-nitrogen hydrolase [Polyangiaceae bacterium]